MPKDLHYTALEKLQVPRPVDRLNFITQAVKGKNVLDLGAYDETALDRKEERYWLHGRMAKTAQSVLGIDSSEKLPEDGVITSSNSKIIRGDILELNDVANLNDIEVIVAGELIEHLPNTLEFLTSIRSLSALRSKTFILSTPNAACLSNLTIGAFGRESNHHDHLQIYSYKTLHTLFLKAGFQDWHFQPYHAIYPEMIENSSGIMKRATQIFQSCIHAGEYVFPLLSGGWVIQVKI